MKSALLALNGALDNVSAVKEQCMRLNGFKAYDVVIGVDGGTKWLEAMHLKPHMIIGDMDSHKGIYHGDASVEIIPFPPEKDFTDAELALEVALERGVTTLVIIGALGGRADHMLGNMYLLEHSRDNLEMIIVDAQNEIRLYHAPMSLALSKGSLLGDYISLIPVTESIRGINLIGFKYPLDQATIKRGQTIGISNELQDDEGRIEVATGSFFLVNSKDEKGA